MNLQNRWILALAALAYPACLGSNAARADEAEGGIITIIEENDAFAQTDRDYTAASSSLTSSRMEATTS